MSSVRLLASNCQQLVMVEDLGNVKNLANLFELFVTLATDYIIVYHHISYHISYIIYHISYIIYHIYIYIYYT